MLKDIKPLFYILTLCGCILLTACGLTSTAKIEQQAIALAQDTTEVPRPATAPPEDDVPEVETSAAVETPTPTPSPDSNPLPKISKKPEPTPDYTQYDTVIENARLMNPETRTDLSSVNIGIKDGKIAAISKAPLHGEHSYDVSGYIVAPGFIDIDSYEPNNFGEKYKIADGVTTNLLMHGGAANAKSWYGSWNRNPRKVNYGASNFVTKIRSSLGYGITTPMTKEADLQRLSDTIAQNIIDGALGVSISTEYTPGVQGAEMLAAFKVAAQYGVGTYHHIRYSTNKGENNSIKALQEVIDLSEATGASIHILHITSTGSTFCADEAYSLIESYIDKGLDITADLYPYDSWATYLGSMRFSKGWQDRFGLDYSDLQLANHSARFTEADFARYRTQNRLVIANGSIPEEEVRLALTKPYVYTASDTILETSLDSHPRGAGNYARLIGKYVREENVLSLMDALAKTSYLPAKQLGPASYDIRSKGRIEIGADADLAIFDFNTVIDKATNEDVAQYSEGFKYVFVNGELVYNNVNGDHIFPKATPGNPIYSHVKSPDQSLQPIRLADETDLDALDVYELFGLEYVSASVFCGMNNLGYELAEDGSIVIYASDKTDERTVPLARMSVSDIACEILGTDTYLDWMPLIFKGDIYIPLKDALQIAEYAQATEQ